MISTGILGISVVTLAELYTSAARGVAERDAITDAVDVATQCAEQFATMDPDQVPACAGSSSCRAAPTAFSTELPPVGAFNCTRWVDGPAVPDPQSGQVTVGTKYRVDAVVGDHPDPNREAEARLLTINVCWSDATGAIHEVQLRRLLVPGA